MVSNKNCKYCGCSFLGNHNEKYCSEQCSKDGRNKLRREDRLKKELEKEHKCLHCGNHITKTEGKKLNKKFCSNECKVKYHSIKIVEKYKIEGYPQKTKKQKDSFNEERRKIRRDIYIAQEHKCKECGTILTLEHYPKIEFCSTACSVKFHSKVVNRINKTSTKVKVEMVKIMIKPGTWVEIPKDQQHREEEIRTKYLSMMDIKNKIKGPVSWAVIQG